MTTCKAEVLEAHIEYGLESMHLNLKIHQMHFFLFITMNLVQRVNQTKRYGLKNIIFWPLYRVQGEAFLFKSQQEQVLCKTVKSSKVKKTTSFRFILSFSLKP